MNINFLSRYNMLVVGNADEWYEGMPLGNGKLGSTVYGGEVLKVAVDRIDLWDERPNPRTLEKDFSFENLKRLSLSGDETDWNERLLRYDSIFSELAYPTKITAGRIVLKGNLGNAECFSLDLKSATATVKYKNARVKFFISGEEGVGCIKTDTPLIAELQVPGYFADKVKGLGYAPEKRYKKSGVKYYIQETLDGKKFGLFLLQNDKSKRGESFYTVASSDDADDFVAFAINKLHAAAKKGFRKLHARHLTEWKKFWNESAVITGDLLIDKTYYRSWYLFKSCSIENSLPMPLQGVWTADDDNLPPWKGLYFFDTNIQLSYQSYLAANHIKNGKAIVDYLWNSRDKFERFTKKFFGVDGLLIPGMSTVSSIPAGGWAQYAYSPVAAIWAAQSFDEYYRYLDDIAFLKERAFPFFERIERAVSALLVNDNGKLRLPLSTSPEIFDNTKDAYLTPDSNFDLAMLKYLYSTLIEYCGVLNKDGGKFVEILNSLDDFALDENGALMLDRKKSLEVSHRHFSHTACLYPLNLIRYDTEEHKRIYRASMAQVERLGSGLWVGFSFPSCAQVYALMKNGNGAYAKIEAFCKGFVGENGFHLNGDFKGYGYSSEHYKAFTLEASFAFCDALHKMLVQEADGRIELLPAVPDEWKENKIVVRNMRCYKAIILSFVYKKRKIKSVEISVENQKTVYFKNNFTVKRLKNCIAEYEKDFIKVTVSGGNAKIYCK